MRVTCYNFTTTKYNRVRLLLYSLHLHPLHQTLLTPSLDVSSETFSNRCSPAHMSTGKLKLGTIISLDSNCTTLYLHILPVYTWVISRFRKRFYISCSLWPGRLVTYHPTFVVYSIHRLFEGSVPHSVNNHLLRTIWYLTLIFTTTEIICIINHIFLLQKLVLHPLSLHLSCKMRINWDW